MDEKKLSEKEYREAIKKLNGKDEDWVNPFAKRRKKSYLCKKCKNQWHRRNSKIGIAHFKESGVGYHFLIKIQTGRYYCWNCEDEIPKELEDDNGLCNRCDCDLSSK